MDILEVYEAMARARAFELSLALLWEEGQISGEMHLGTGEEAIAAGVTAHLRPGDAVALDHRPTPVLTLLGVDRVALLREMLGRSDGLCHGRGGHMHLFSPQHLAASSGIVGASGPLAAGFALAARELRPGNIAVAFFGDGAANQGMLLESMNLSVAWKLPMLFVCKDNTWAIFTQTPKVTGGNLVERAIAFGLEADAIDGLDISAVHEAAGHAVAHVRTKRAPYFLHARCSRLDGHMLGDPGVRQSEHPVREGTDTLKHVLSSTAARPGGSLTARMASVAHIMGVMRGLRKSHHDMRHDPLVTARKKYRKHRAAFQEIDARIEAETHAVLETALSNEEVH